MAKSSKGAKPAKTAKSGKTKASKKAQGALAPQPVARFDAAGQGRRFRGWVAPSTGPNRATAGANPLRQRARDAGRNEWAADNATTQWSVNLVGTGILPRPRGRDPQLKQRLLALWQAWVRQADADGVFDFYGLQNLITRNWLESGEVFVRLRWRRESDGLAIPLQLQVLEAEMVPDRDGRTPSGNEIRRGIEFDRIGRRVAYHVLRQHPGDGLGDAIATVRIPADQILHIYEPLRPGQLRGVSDFAPILAKLRGVGNFDDAVLHRQELTNLFTAFIKKALPSGPAELGLNQLTGQYAEHDTSGIPMAALEPGATQELLDGEDIVFSQPPGPGADYADYMREQGLHVAAGSHMPYELLTGDLRDISDRTLRVAIQGFRRHCEQRQWLVLIPQLCDPVRRAWALAARLAGKLAPADQLAALDTLWVPQGWEYLHPVQDVDADIKAIDAGLRSRSSVITRRGDDPEAVDMEAAEDAARAKSLGLTFGAAETRTQAGGATPEPSSAPSNRRSE
ncbi:phage portal protein [Chitinibacteraceae bacterium HSL-7]